MALYREAVEGFDRCLRLCRRRLSDEAGGASYSRKERQDRHKQQVRSRSEGRSWIMRTCCCVATPALYPCMLDQLPLRSPTQLGKGFWAK